MKTRTHSSLYQYGNSNRSRYFWCSHNPKKFPCIVRKNIVRSKHQHCLICQCGILLINTVSRENIMPKNQESNIWRNIGSIPAAFAVWLLATRLAEHVVMLFIRGEDEANTKFLFFFPVEPIADWIVPIFQCLVVPGLCVYTAAAVATSKLTYFAVVMATLNTAIMLLGPLAISFGSFDVPGVIIFRVWLCTLIGWGPLRFLCAWSLKSSEPRLHKAIDILIPSNLQMIPKL